MTINCPGTVRNSTNKPRCAPGLALLLLGVLLAGCGGSSGGNDSGTPIPPPPISFELIYPAQTSLTDADQVSVVGVADPGRVTSVVVKNESVESVALLDSAGRWRTTVPLLAGSNSLAVELTETDGRVTELPLADVESSPVLSNPAGVVFDPINDRVLVLDSKQVLSFDAATAGLTVLSGPATGSGPTFGLASHVALDGSGAIFVADFRRILRVDPTTGDRSEPVVLPGEAGPIANLAYDQALNRLFAVGAFGDLYVANLAEPPPIAATTIKPLAPFGISSGGPADGIYVPSTDSIFSVNALMSNATEIDTDTGDRQPVAIDFGGFPTPLVGIDYDSANARLLILGAFGAVFSLDPATQSSSLLQSPPISSTVPMALVGASIDDGVLWSVSQLPGELRSIDLATGNQSIAAESRAGRGDPPGPMLAGRYDAVSDRIIAIADIRLIAIDPDTGSRRVLATLADTGELTSIGPIQIPGGIVLSQDGSLAWVSNLFGPSVIEVDLASGVTRDVTSPEVGSGELPDQISSLAVNADEDSLYVSDRFTARIFEVDIATGQRDVFADLSPTLNGGQIRALVLDTGAGRLLLNVAPLTPASTIAPAIYALDLSTLDLEMLVDLSDFERQFNAQTGPGVPAAQMSLSADGTTLYAPVSGNADVPFARIDLVQREAFPLGAAGSGVPVFLPSAIEVTADNRLLALDTTSALMIIDPGTGQRSIVSK